MTCADEAGELTAKLLKLGQTAKLVRSTGGFQTPIGMLKLPDHYPIGRVTEAGRNGCGGADLTPRRTWWRASTNSLHSIRPTIKPRTRAGLELTVRGSGLPTLGSRIEGKSKTERLLPSGPFGPL
jgi:hypothetical protein